MKTSFLRLLIMLQHVPRHPAKTITRTLNTLLQDKGFEVTQRTIQRDLKALALILPELQVDDEKDYPGWSWSKYAPIRELPVMDPNMALTFQLAEHFLETMSPPTVLNRLRPYFDSADNVLRADDNPGYTQWMEKIRILSRTQPLVPATIQEDVVEVIYEALFKGRQFRGRYVRRDGDEVEYDLHPLGLIFRESVVYLVATIWNYNDPRQFALHRFRSCNVLEQKIASPDDFDLDNYLETGSFEYCETKGKMFRLKALFFNGAGYRLFETPLSEDQEITTKDDDQIQIEATVKDSQQLRWWLLGFGPYVEVLKPEELREEFKVMSGNLAERYR